MEVAHETSRYRGKKSPATAEYKSERLKISLSMNESVNFLIIGTLLCVRAMLDDSVALREERAELATGGRRAKLTETRPQ
jgi:hypothetical protein